MANKLSEIDWFSWNGIKCTDFGMHVLGQPNVVHPKERVSTETIPGRSGALTVLEGSNVYDPITLSCVCIIDDQYDSSDNSNRIAKICGWLRGSGNVIFANRLDGFYKARITNQIGFDKILAGHPHMSFTVQFQCDPFFYLHSGSEPIVSETQSIMLSNLGNIPTEPIIKLFGTGEGTLMVGTNTTFISSFKDVKYIIMDCSAKIAYTGTPKDPTDPVKLLGTRVSGDWPVIPIGNSFATFSGGITKIEIIPKWAYV